jgi:hypothetical protein
MAVSLDGQSEPRTHLRGRWLALARAAWVLVILLTVLMFVISLPARYNQLANHSGDVIVGVMLHASDPAQLGMSPDAYASYYLTLEVLFALIFSAVAIAIFARKSDDWMALLTSMALLTFGTASIPTTTALVEAQSVWSIPQMLVKFIGWTSVGLLYFLFPDGRFVPRPMIWAFLLFAALSIPWSFLVQTPYYPERWPTIILVGALLLLWLPPIFSQIYKYRTVLGATQRQQAKWVVFGITVAVCGSLAVTLPGLIDPALSQPSPQRAFYELAYVPALYLCLAFLPISIGVSILRYRLYDIDPIINRALVYVPLTAILAGLYSASITFFQKLFLAVTGQASDAAIVLTTLAVASSFTPIKNWLQAKVDRRFKETRDTTTELKAFDKQVQSVIEVIDKEQITRRLLEEATLAFGATGGAVYLNQGGQLRMAHASDGWDGNAQLVIPMSSDSEYLGLLQLGARRNGREYGLEDREVLQQTVDRVACAIALQGRTLAAEPAPGVRDQV